jgi:hypothetical protein
MKTIRSVVAVGFMLGLGGLVLPACGSMGTDVCKSTCDCEGCNDNERQACLVVYEESREAAADYSCGSQFDDAENCQLDKAVCKGNNWTTTGSDCEGQRLILEQCIRDNSSLKR